MASSPAYRDDVATTQSDSIGARVKAWVDIENPPQVQYLVPLVVGLQHRGHEVLVTSRDYDATFEMLRARDVEFVGVGRHFGAAKVAKVAGSLRRAFDLRGVLRRHGMPDLVISASRSAALAARSAGVPSFALCDYEHVNLSVFRATRSFVVHPDVISADSFRARGVRPQLLVPYHGIKEDITFADVKLDAVAPHSFPELENVTALRVLVRPPAEESHYHRAASSDVLRRVLTWLAARDDVVVVYSPRYAWQAEALRTLTWRNQPVVLTEAVDYVSLYKAVDVVISGGGTMVREAAYLGVPAVSAFQGTHGDVDRHLQSIGRLTAIASPEDLERLDLGSLARREPMLTNVHARDDIVDAVLRTRTRSRGIATER